MTSSSGSSYLWLGTGGSSGRTLAAIERHLLGIDPQAQFTFVDTQPFNLRTGGTTQYSGQAKVIMATPDQVGLRLPTRSWTANLLASGARFAYERMVGYALRVLQSAQARVLVLCHDRIYVETAFVEAASRLGIATVMVQEGPFCVIGHGPANSWKLRLKQAAAPWVNWLGIIPPIPDYGFAGHTLVLAASEAYRKKWIDAGLPANRVEVAGIPRYDFLASLKSPRRNAAKPKLLYLVQPFAAHGKVDAVAANRLLVELAAALNALALTQEFEFRVRSHPRSSTDDVAALRTELRVPITMDDTSMPLEIAVQACDVVLGHYSSGLLESLMIGKPIVCMPVPPEAFAEPGEALKQQWLTQLGAPVASAAPDIERAILKMLDPNAAMMDPELLEDEVGTIDGLATRRCALAIHALARNAPSPR